MDRKYLLWSAGGGIAIIVSGILIALFSGIVVDISVEAFAPLVSLFLIFTGALMVLASYVLCTIAIFRSKISTLKKILYLLGIWLVPGPFAVLLYYFMEN